MAVHVDFVVIFVLLSAAALVLSHKLVMSEFINTQLIVAIQNYLVNAARVDPSLKGVIASAQASCSNSDMQSQVKARAAGKTIASAVTSGMTSYVLYILLGCLGAALFARAWMLGNQNAQAHLLPFLHRQSWKVELGILGLALMPAVVPLVMYAFIYTKATFFSSVTVVKMLKLSRLISEMDHLAKLSTANVQSTSSCSGGNCFTSEDRKTLVDNLNVLISDFKKQLSLVQGGAKSQFKAVGYGTWILAFLLVLFSVFVLNGAFLTGGGILAFGTISILAVYGVAMCLTALDMKSPKFQKSDSYIASIVCDGNVDATTKFIAKLGGKDAGALSRLA